MVLVDGKEHPKGIWGDHKPSPCPLRHLSRGHAHHQPRGPDHYPCKSPFQKMWAKFGSHLMSDAVVRLWEPDTCPSTKHLLLLEEPATQTQLLGLTFCTKPNSPESTSSMVGSSEVLVPLPSPSSLSRHLPGPAFPR